MGETGCRCNCGYRCGGPGNCKLKPFECLAQTEDHFVSDCGHKWDGPEYRSDDNCVSSATCSACGAVAIYHDMRFGP